MVASQSLVSNLSLLLMKYILGIDQGTTQTTAVVVDENASFVDKNSILLPARFPNPGWVEQDPHDIVHTE